MRDSDRKKDGGLPRGRAWLCVVAALLCAAALLAPAAAAARDLVVYGEPTLEKALKSVGFLWQARTGKMASRRRRLHRPAPDRAAAPS